MLSALYDVEILLNYHVSYYLRPKFGHVEQCFSEKKKKPL